MMPADLREGETVTQMARILVADECDTFVQSATDALNDRGYETRAAFERGALQETLRNWPPDVLVVSADFTEGTCGEKQPDGEMVAVVISDSPRACIPAGFLDTPVLGHLSRPVDLEALCAKVSRAAAYRRSVQTLRQVETIARQTPPSAPGCVQSEVSEHGPAQMYASEYFGRSLMEMYRALEAMSALAWTLWAGRDRPVCPMFQCPRLDVFARALEQTVESLEKTKRSFKSRELGNLRKQLETLLKAIDNDIPPDEGD